MVMFPGELAVVALILAGAVVASVYRIAAAWERFAPIPTPVAATVITPADIPEDLMAIATQETEPWAQEEVVRVIQERYETLRDWNRVRSSMGVGIIPEA